MLTAAVFGGNAVPAPPSFAYNALIAFCVSCGLSPELRS
jgi:hypothetical protein